MNKEVKENKEEKFEITAKIFIQQLKESISSGVKNIKTEIKNNEDLFNILKEKHLDNLKELEKKVEVELNNLKNSLTKIEAHKVLIDELEEDIKDKKIEEVVTKVITILLRK